MLIVGYLSYLKLQCNNRSVTILWYNFHLTTEEVFSPKKSLMEDWIVTKPIILERKMSKERF